MKTRLAQQEAVCKHISKQQELLKPAVTLDDRLQATNKTYITSQCPSKPDHNSARASVGIYQPYSRLNVQHSCLLNPKSIKPFRTKDAPICVCQQAANWQKKNTQTLQSLTWNHHLQTDGSFFNYGNFHVSCSSNLYKLWLFFMNEQIATFFFLFYEGRIKTGDIIRAGESSLL